MGQDRLRLDLRRAAKGGAGQGVLKSTVAPAVDRLASYGLALRQAQGEDLQLKLLMLSLSKHEPIVAGEHGYGLDIDTAVSSNRQIAGHREGRGQACPRGGRVTRTRPTTP